jgi:UDP-4-amino-4,6-dideoxy-N-acetyl-beta-L-altrosamine N-acetyltransferase
MDLDMVMFGILRTIADNELELMREWRNLPTVRANMYSQHEISYDEHMNWWERTKDRKDQKYFMCELAGLPAGIAAFTGIDMQNKNAAWAFYSSPTAPRGAGGKIEFLMLEYAFSTLQLHKLFCEVLAFNKPVIKLHEKFGFKIEGIFRNQYCINDVFVDTFRLGILANEWQEKRQEMSEKLIAQTRVKK